MKQKLLKVLEAWCPTCGKHFTEERGFFWKDEEVKCHKCNTTFKV